MAKKEKKFYSSVTLEGMIRKKYEPPAWVVLEEVANGTGSNCWNFADILAFGVWPSRGLQIEGFEIKSYRSDWTKELKNPSKAETIAKHCDLWWVVAAEDVVKLEEVPPNWGWYAPTARGGLRVAKPAQALEPQEIGRSFLMSIVRNISRNYVAERKVKDLVEKRAKEVAKHQHDENKFRLRRLEVLEEKVDKFHKASGIDLGNEYSFPAKQVGVIVKMVLDRSLPWRTRQISDIASDLKRIAEALEAHPYFEATKEEAKCATS